MNRAKIQPSHLGRKAYIYVRQSTQHQVLHHRESQQRQYELTVLAGDLGWHQDQIEIIDDDLGRSASGRTNRAGFERLVSSVALGRAGIVLGLEVSRLARNNRDWYELLDLCAVRETLIGDADGIYDPRAYNDRLLLGLKGTMSEAELHILRGRMEAGLRHKAKKGELRFRLPAGYDFDDAGCIVKTSDEQVVHMVQFVFAKFFEVATISGVLSYLLHEGLRLPRRDQSGSIRWEISYYRAVYLMLTNPLYAGTYAYGRTQVADSVDENGQRKVARRVKTMAEWDVILHDHHPGYISWADFERIERMIARNRPTAPQQASGVVREGAALLQGIARCGRCGRSMHPRYSGRPGKRPTPQYVCVGGRAQRRAGFCASIGGRRIDTVVSQLFLKAISESDLDVQLAALAKLDDEDDAVTHQLALQLERARYEAGRTERQYNAVEPENRVVARTLERRWNDALTTVSELEAQLTQRKQQVATRLTDKEERELRRLARNLPKLWARRNVTDKDRKALLRAAIDEVHVLQDTDVVKLKVIWKGGAVTEASVDRLRVPPPPPTPPDLIALIRELSTRFTDAQIARILIRRRIKTPKKQLTFTARHVGDLRRSYGIVGCQQPLPDGDGDGDTYTAEYAAKLLGVSPATICRWVKLGLLVGEQPTPNAPWSIRVTQADRERLSGCAPDGWLSVNEAASELAVSKQTILNWVQARKIAYVYATRGRRRGLRIDVNSAPKRSQARLLD
jgi:excisionase family DNA binding protein